MRSAGAQGHFRPLRGRARRRSIDVVSLLAAAKPSLAAAFAPLAAEGLVGLCDLVVLHSDADFQLVAATTGQDHQWVVPRGTAD
jgi:hypothetical protein